MMQVSVHPNEMHSKNSLMMVGDFFSSVKEFAIVISHLCSYLSQQKEKNGLTAVDGVNNLQVYVIGMESFAMTPINPLN